MPELDVDNAVTITTTAFTTTKAGAIHGNVYNAAGGNIVIGNATIPFNNSAQRVDIDFVPAGKSVSISAANDGTYKLLFIPYKDN